MRYPNTRYGNPTELQYYAQGISTKDLCKMLRRSEKSITSWMNGTRKMPFWVPELLRLRRIENDLKLRQMGIEAYRHRFGIVKGDVIQLRDLSRSSESKARSAASNHEQPDLDCSYEIRRSAAR